MIGSTRKSQHCGLRKRHRFRFQPKGGPFHAKFHTLVTPFITNVENGGEEVGERPVQKPWTRQGRGLRSNL